jgi:hypothetical protein
MPQAEQLPLSNALVLPAVYVSYSFREGYRKYDGVKEYHHVYNTDPILFGLAVGKRFALKNPSWRIQSTLDFGRGSAKDGEFYVTLTNGNDILAYLYSNYLTGGIVGDVHRLFPAGHGRAYFVSAGLGMHLTGFNSEMKTDLGQRIGNTKTKMRGTFSPSLNLGGGIERVIANNRAAALGYNFRFMQSARYMETGSLFPIGASYREFFYSHMLIVQILLPDPRYRTFF